VLDKTDRGISES